MNSLLVTLAIVLGSPFTSLAAADVVDIEPGTRVYTAGAGQNPILGMALERIMAVAGDGSEYFRPVDMVAMRSVIDLPNIPFYGIVMHVSGTMQRCDQPVVRSREAVIDEVIKSLQSGIDTEELGSIWQKAEAKSAAFKEARNQCSVSMTADGDCMARLEPDYFDFSSSRRYRLSLNQGTCATLGRYTDRTLSISFRKITDDAVQFEDVVIE